MDKKKSITVKNSLCRSCEEQESIYQCLCPDCIETSLQLDAYKIEPLDILQYIDTLDLNQFTHSRVKEIVTLQRFLLNYKKKEISFNPIIETKCLQCGQVNERNLKFKNNPHGTKCKKCSREYCSNCLLNIHTRKKFYLRCEEYKQARDIYFEPFTKSWISAIMNSEKQHQEIMRKIQVEQKSVAYFKSKDLRKCPYTDYDAANAYEKEMVQNGEMFQYQMSTRNYTKETWYKSPDACKSDPVIKENCDDMYCAKHNPERVNQLRAQGISVGLNSKGCGKKIRWKYWISINPKYDEKFYYKMNKSTLIKCTESDGLITHYKTCSVCNQSSKSFFVTCLNHKCTHAYQPVCGKCITGATSIVKKNMISIVTDNDIFQLTQEDDGVYRGVIKSVINGITDKVFINNKLQLLAINSHWSHGNFKNLDLSNVESCNDISFEWMINKTKIHSISSCIFEQFEISNSKKRKKKIYNGCIRKKHILYFDGFDELQHRIDNYDQWLIENKKSYIISKFIKRSNIRFKFKQMLKVYKFVKRFMIYCKWKKTIRNYQIYLIEQNAATVVNKFMYKFYIKKVCYSTVRNSIYYNREQKKIKAELKQLNDHVQECIQAIEKECQKLKKRQKEPAYINLNRERRKINKLIKSCKEEKNKLLIYNIKNNQNDLLDNLYIRNATNKHMINAINIKQQICTMCSNLHAKVFTKSIENLGKPTRNKNLMIGPTRHVCIIM